MPVLLLVAATIASVQLSENCPVNLVQSKAK